MAETYTSRIGSRQYTPYSKIVQAASMSEQHERLRDARVKAGFRSAAAAARAMEIGYPGYAHHENGTRGLDPQTAERYARAFKTTPEWLMWGRSREAPSLGPLQARDVVKLSWVAAGRLGPAAPIESITHDGRVRVEGLPPGDWVWLDVRGRSMERIAPDGCAIILNRKDKTLVSSKFYVFTASDGEATFKRYKSNPDRFTPYSLDPDEEPIYPDIETDRDWKVFGRVYRVIIEI